MEIINFRNATNVHNCFGKLVLDDGTVKMARWTFNTDYATTFGFSLRASGVAADDVTIDGAFGDWFPA